MITTRRWRVVCHQLDGGNTAIFATGKNVYKSLLLRQLTLRKEVFYMLNRKYYHAYDDRYRQVHGQNLEWFYDNPTPVVMETIRNFNISKQEKILEIGCGEGRDALHLLSQSYDLLATDVSEAAIEYCRNKIPAHSDRFQILDCITGELDATFDFVYAVAVLHMLVPDEDRNGFYAFIRNHLKDNGIALICTMGDGSVERQSNISTAFDLQDRTHQQTGKTVKIAGTSCRMISFQTFETELDRNGLAIIKLGVCTDEPNFTQLMYAVVKPGGAES